MEMWKSVKGYEGIYEVSNYGNVRSLDRKIEHRTKNGLTKRKVKGILMKQSKNKKGYSAIDLRKNNVRKYGFIHRLVATAFIGCPPTSEHQINHLDGNNENNHVSNLEWVTLAENMDHAHRNGLRHMTVSDETVFKIRRLHRETDLTTGEIAKECGVNRGYVYKVVNNLRRIHTREEVLND